MNLVTVWPKYLLKKPPIFHPEHKFFYQILGYSTKNLSQAIWKGDSKTQIAKNVKKQYQISSRLHYKKDHFT